MALKVLVVQPDPLASQPLLRYFKERGYEVWYVSDLKQAEAQLTKSLPQIIILDLHFPGNDWLAFLRQAQQSDSQIKIILTNKYPDLQREMVARNNGIGVFLRQPYTVQWIESALRVALEKPQEKKTPAAAGLSRTLPLVRVPVRFKITLPYLFLAILFAVASALILNRVLLDSIRSRFYLELQQTGRQAADWMVQEEDRLLTTLRLVANSEGVAEAIEAGDADRLRSLVLPVAVNAGERDIAVLDSNGIAVITMRRKPDSSLADYEFASQDPFFQQLDFVQSALQAKVDQYGNKFSGLVLAPWGATFYVSGPVFNSSGKLVGVVLMGNPLASLVTEIKQQVLADVTIYHSTTGQPLASTIFNEQVWKPVDPSLIILAMYPQDGKSPERDLEIFDGFYSEVLGPWEARSSSVLMGGLGVMLPQTFLIETTRRTQIEVFLLVAFSILLVIALGFWLASRLTRPLMKLVAASAEVAQGNLEVKIDSRGNDELAVVSQSFNYMVAGLQEGYMYRDLLGRTVSPEVREQLRQTFSSGNLRLEGQQAVATVLMTDIRGFTTLSEQAEPVTVLGWLNEYFSILVPIVNAHSGVVNKFDGDAMLAFFGILPRRLSPKLAARNACLTALEILKAVNELNSQRLQRGEPVFRTGIGLNTGLVIAGSLGSTDRLHYTIIGDTVNTTQRIEGLTRDIFEESGILVSSATYGALSDSRDEFNFETVGMRAVRGKAEQVMIYRLLPRLEVIPGLSDKTHPRKVVQTEAQVDEPVNLHAETESHEPDASDTQGQG
ncbi:MAG TPA: adenylate/guanylate cyclase domain-containing protein [Anaerolineaceae bacterium]|nr:adenylate/guanylate cyclase domain-containing protein [Anaerolineaceae bacterium]